MASEPANPYDNLITYFTEHGQAPSEITTTLSSYTDVLLPTLERKGMLHEGWYTSPNFDINSKVQIGDLIDSINTSLYAKWNIERSLVSDYLLYDIADGIRNYFGCHEKTLLLEDIPAYLATRFLSSDVLSTAIDKDGSIFNGTGYIKGRRLSASEGEAAGAGHILTGYIPAKYDDKFIIQSTKDYTVTYFYAFDTNFNRLENNYALSLTTYPLKVFSNNLTEEEKQSIAYIRFTFAPATGVTIDGTDFTIHKVL